jgi:5,10-methylenetetrahydromethanopterin reductase
MAAAGYAVALRYHARYDLRGIGDLADLPRGAEWRQRVEALPARTRHLAVHDRHLIALNDIDQGIVTGEILASSGLATDANGWRVRLAESERAGVTEIVYQPAGPDIERELTMFAAVAGL